MRLIIPFFFISFTLPVLTIAQTFPFFDFQPADKQSCPHDSSEEVLTFPRWEGYQTTNGEWDGQIDTTVCIDIAHPDTNQWQRALKIDYSQINPNKPVFIRAQLNDSNKVLLDSNSVYRLHFEYKNGSLNSYHLDTSQNCANYLCSGTLVGVQIPNSTGTGDTMRWTQTPFNNGPTDGFGGPASCFVTEKFVNHNYLREFIFKFTFNQKPDKDSVLFSSYVRKLSDYGVEKIRSIEANLTTDSNYIARLKNSFNFLLMYTDSTYPSPQNISYLPVSPEPNIPQKDTLRVIIDENVGALLSQPFVQLRGTHPIGDTTTRHQVNLVNNGGKICMPGFIEKRFEYGNKYVHKAGKVNFESPTSCFLFGKGGALKVPDNTTFHYGSKDRGMLLLKTGGSIEIGQNAELILKGQMNLKEYQEDEGPKDIYMTLQEGSRLTFAEGSRLTNWWSKDGTIKLNIYMKGGVLDDSGLPAEDRLLINRIYPSEKKEKQNRLRILENPLMNDPITYSVTLPDQRSFTYQLIDISGKVLRSGKNAGIKGKNQYRISSSELSSGIYLLSVDIGEGYTNTKKVVISSND